MDRIGIFGVPRSGTSWLSQIVNSNPSTALRFQPLFSYGHKDMLNEKSSALEINKFFVSIYNSTDSFALMNTTSQSHYPKFSKSKDPTHLVFKETRYLNLMENFLDKSEIKIIGICRNPIDTLTSWINTPKEFHPKWIINDEWKDAPSKNKGIKSEYFGFNKWLLAMKNFIRLRDKFPNRFYLMNYEVLKVDTLAETLKIYDFAGLKISAQTIEFIDKSKTWHNPNPYAVYKNRESDYAYKLPENIQLQIKDILSSENIDYNHRV